ncbi:MAG: AtpZ/AtpI family protein [Gemmatimonadota bacterium]|nr:AtpZ/AtpI family protein [Gemmatimonadota bacterium]
MRTGLGQVGPYLGIGLEFAVGLLVFIFIGRYLDKLWGTEPWLLLTGCLLGFTAGFYGLIKTLSNLDHRTKRQQQKRRKPGE